MSDFTDYLTDLIENKLEKVQLSFIAEIVTFNKETMRAEVKPLLKTTTTADPDTPEVSQTPNIRDVPVQLIFASNQFIRPDYSNGDKVHCILSATDIEKPVNDGLRAETLSDRFSLSYCTVISGVTPESMNPPSSWSSEDGLLIGSENDYIKFDNGITIEAGSDLQINGNVIIDGTVTADDFIPTVGVSYLVHVHLAIGVGLPTGPPI